MMRLAAATVAVAMAGAVAGWVWVIKADNSRMAAVIEAQDQQLRGQEVLINELTRNSEATASINVKLRQQVTAAQKKTAATIKVMEALPLNEAQEKCDSVALPGGYADSLRDLTTDSVPAR